MTNPVKQTLAVHICADAKDAIRQGFLYRPPVYKPIELTKVVVVRNGTESGKPTVDFVLEDEKGQKYIFMLTGALLSSIPV